MTLSELRLPQPPALALALALTLTGASPAPAGDMGGRLPIVERSIEHHGGDLYHHSVSRFELCSKSGCFEVSATVDGDHYIYDVSGAASEGLRRVRTTNTSIERWRDGEPIPVPDDQAQGLRDWVMARIYFAFLPYRLDDPSVRAEDLGIEAWDDRLLHKVKITFAPGSSTDASDEFVYWLDPQTGRVELFAYSYRTNGGGLRFRRAVNHRRVGGLLFFDQENYGLDGPDLSVDQITPRMLAEQMRHVSTVRLENLRVEALAPTPASP